MRRLTVLLAAVLGLAAPPLAAAEPSSGAEVCEGCDALMEAALAHPRRAADRPRDAGAIRRKRWRSSA
jgi:hypothetical protein